jgi:hypothetical protein
VRRWRSKILRLCFRIDAAFANPHIFALPAVSPDTTVVPLIHR